MRLRRFALLAWVLTLGCQSPSAAPGGQPVPPHRPAPSQQASPLVHLSAAAAILRDEEVGLPRTLGRDRVGLSQAAEEEQNQPLALTRYRSWGWLEKATRTWRAGDQQITEELVVLTRPEGARQAFSQAATTLLLGCGGATGAEQCAASGEAGPARMALQLGPYYFALSGTRVDLVALARLQVARLTRPPG